MLCPLERQIDGDSFTQLTREDFSVIFPSDEKFLVGSRLYKIAQKARVSNQDVEHDTGNLLDELSALEGDVSYSSQSNSFSSRASTPASNILTPSSIHSANISVSSSSRCTQHEFDQQPRKKRRVVAADAGMMFKLPVFSPNIKQCIKKDAFYTSAQRNCLIKEACTFLRNHYWEKERPITNHDKRELARSLYKLAPKSLGDSENVSKPEVASLIIMISGYDF